MFHEQLIRKYQNAEPFPHIVLEESDILDANLLHGLLREFPDMAKNKDREFNNSKEKKRVKNTDLPESALELVSRMHHPEFLLELEKLTGIQNLHADPNLVGGGFHELPPGGFLGMHTDFNYNKQLGMYRRLNLLIYLNIDWKKEYGGTLILGSKQEKEINPDFGTVVIFSTSKNSWHGNPKPVTVDRSRKSFAFYYYSPNPPDDDDNKERDTVFL